MGARLLVAGASIAVALTVAAAPAPHTVSFTYQADQGLAVPRLERPVASWTRSATGQSTAVLGKLWFTPPGSGFQLRVDDVGALPGHAVPILLLQANNPDFGGLFCLTSGKTRSFRGALPHEEVLVIMNGVTMGPSLTSYRCDGPATLGTAMVSFR